MSGSAVVGALRVDLGMETAAFTKGAKHAEETLGKLHEVLSGFAAKFAAAFAFEKIVEGIHGSIEAMDALGKTAQKVGIPVEELSKLSLAAKLTDTSMETLANSTIKLSKNLEMIQGGKGGNAGAALDALGISALDANGKLKPTSEIIADVAGKFNHLKDGADKTAIAIALFGKAGAEMIPFLNQGKQGLEEAAMLQEKFGLTTQASADQAAAFDENIHTLWAALDGLYSNIAKNLLPELIDMTNAFVDFVTKGETVKTIVDFMSDGFAKLGVMFRQDEADLRKLGTAFDFIINGSPEFQAMVAASTKNVKAMSVETNTLALQLNAAADAQRRFSEQVSNTADKGNLHNDKKDAPGFTELTTHLAKSKKLVDEYAKQVKALFEQTRTPLETYNIELAKLEVLHHKINKATGEAYINDELYARGLAKLREQFAKTTTAAASLSEEMAKTIESGFRNWIDSAVNGTFNLTSAIGDLLKSLEKLLLNRAFTQLLSGFGGSQNPMQEGSGGGLGGLLKGLMGFADGGTIMPGGSGGIDSQVVAFRKSPNERVDITKPGQVAGGNGGGTVINLHVDGRGADAGRLTSLEATVKHVIQTLPKTILGAVTREKQANMSFAR